MIPYKDDNPTRHFPILTIALITANIIVFIFQILSPSGSQKIAYTYGAIPLSLLTFDTAQPLHPLLTIFTSMFMHGGLLHLGSNMLYLWIFGNNIEDKLGYVKFIIFYLLCGGIAAFAHAFANPASTIPMIGASGAVSGILGAYILLFPHARVHTLVFFIFFVQVVRLPAIIVIGFWIGIQFINGMISHGTAAHGGIAWFAHIGGFVSGILMIKTFVRNRRRN
ncbi:MAG: rhomboid family intramembrane serine protease [Nitrospiraceae bacterium]|nr:MAG: rhomboid family intramembrane serine protease [Nitrospiraceae bacterium]